MPTEQVCGHCAGALALCRDRIIGEQCGECYAPLCPACTVIVRLEALKDMPVEVVTREESRVGKRFDR